METDRHLFDIYIYIYIYIYGDFDIFIEAERNFLPKEVLICAEEKKMK